MKCMVGGMSEEVWALEGLGFGTIRRWGVECEVFVCSPGVYVPFTAALCAKHWRYLNLSCSREAFLVREEGGESGEDDQCISKLVG